MKMSTGILSALALLLISLEYARPHSLILPPGMEQEKYCEGCVKMVEGIEKQLKEGKSMAKILKNVGSFCKSLGSQSNAETICRHIAENHKNDVTTLRKDESKHQKIKAWLCYESTFACTGVKRDKSLKKDGDEDKLVEALKNMENVKRVPNPVRATDEL